MSMRSMLGFLFAVLFAGNALAKQDTSDDEFDKRGELALSNDTLQLRYLGDGPSMGDARSTVMGTLKSAISC